MVATQEAPEGERLARIEATLDAVLREVSDARADRRDIRSEMRDIRTEMGNIRTIMNRNLIWTMGLMVSILIPMWVSIIVIVLLKT